MSRAQPHMLLIALFVLLVSGPARAGEGPSPPSGETPPGDQEEPAPAPKLLLKGFGNIDVQWRGDDNPASFALGELDFFTTSELTDDLSILAEIVFEPPDSDEPVVDVERYQIKYSPSDAFSIALGRMHTALGYWNQTYHHGAWFQTTAFRPLVYKFEDEGGPLPVHEVGLQVSGTAPLRGLRLEYNLSVSNGRGITHADVQTFRDSNRSKAVNLWVGAAPRAVRGLKLGGVVRFDKIPSDPGRPERGGELEERILGGFAAYVHRRAELLAEILQVRHEDSARGRAYDTLGLYAQGGWRFGRFEPYYRFDRLDYGAGDPFYGPEAAGLRMHTFGLRIDPWAWAAIKLELSRHERDLGPSFAGAAAQVAFTF